MEPTTLTPSTNPAELLDLGATLGEAAAFAVVSGRCTAARAAAIFRIHEEKLYRHAGVTWEDFCPTRLKLSRAEADRTVALWREFGPAYFEVAQFARISPDAFRALAPVIDNGAIHDGGEAVSLTPANATRVANIVAEFRRGLTHRDSTPTVARLEQRAAKLVLDFDAFSHRDANAETRAQLTRALEQTRSSLGRIAQENV